MDHTGHTDPEGVASQPAPEGWLAQYGLVRGYEHFDSHTPAAETPYNVHLMG